MGGGLHSLSFGIGDLWPSSRSASQVLEFSFVGLFVCFCVVCVFSVQSRPSLCSPGELTLETGLGLSSFFFFFFPFPVFLVFFLKTGSCFSFLALRVLCRLGVARTRIFGPDPGPVGGQASQPRTKMGLGKYGTWLPP